MSESVSSLVRGEISPELRLAIATFTADGDARDPETGRGRSLDAEDGGHLGRCEQWFDIPVRARLGTTANRIGLDFSEQ